MRKFSIILDGVPYDFMGADDMYFVGVNGLGTESAAQTASINNDGFFRQGDTSVKSGTINGDLIFKNGYTDYATFANVLLTAKRITLCYQPASAQYKIDVALNFINKSEEGTAGTLVSNLSFVKLTPWYTISSQTGTGSISVTAGGQLGTSVKVTTTTALTDPSLTMTDTDGVFQQIDLTLSTTAGKTLEYSNHPYDCHIIYDGADAIQYADLTTPIFGRSRKAFTIALTGAVMTVEIKRWWRTV